MYEHWEWWAFGLENVFSPPLRANVGYNFGPPIIHQFYAFATPTLFKRPTRTLNTPLIGSRQGQAGTFRQTPAYLSTGGRVLLRV